MNIIIYVCSINIALKIVLIMEKETEIAKMVFKDYYDSLPDDSKETMQKPYSCRKWNVLYNFLL